MDATGQKDDALLARTQGEMIQMNVIEIKSLHGLFFNQPHPSAGAGDDVPPPLRPRDVGCVGKPKGAFRREGEPRRIVKNGRMQPIAAAQIPCTDHPISRKHGLDCRNLKIQRLLQTQDIRAIMIQDLEDPVAAKDPMILAIFRRTAPNIEAHDIQVQTRMGDRIRERIHRGFGGSSPWMEAPKPNDGPAHLGDRLFSKSEALQFYLLLPDVTYFKDGPSPI